MSCHTDCHSQKYITLTAFAVPIAVVCAGTALTVVRCFLYQTIGLQKKLFGGIVLQQRETEVQYFQVERGMMGR